MLTVCSGWSTKSQDPDGFNDKETQGADGDREDTDASCRGKERRRVKRMDKVEDNGVLIAALLGIALQRHLDSLMQVTLQAKDGKERRQRDLFIGDTNH